MAESNWMYWTWIGFACSDSVSLFLTSLSQGNHEKKRSTTILEPEGTLCNDTRGWASQTAWEPSGGSECERMSHLYLSQARPLQDPKLLPLWSRRSITTHYRHASGKRGSLCFEQ